MSWGGGSWGGQSSRGDQSSRGWSGGHEESVDNVEMDDYTKCSMLYGSVCQGNMDEVKAWFESGKTICDPPPPSMGPSDMVASAFQMSHPDVAFHLIERLGVDLNAPISDLRTQSIFISSLMDANAKISVETLKTMLEKGADPNAADPVSNLTPLACCMMATASDGSVGRPELLKALLDAGADPNVNSSAIGGTVFHYGATCGASTCLQVLMDEDRFDFQARDLGGVTCEEAIFSNCLTDCVFKLVSKRAGAGSLFELTRAYVSAVHPQLPNVSFDGVFLIPMSWFMEQGKVPHYDVCKEAGMLTTADSIGNLGDKKIIFLSHRWESPEFPDPDNNQFDHLRAFVEGSSKAWDYIWADYSCICQELGSDLFFKNLQNIPTAVFLATDVLIVPRTDGVALPPKEDVRAGELNITYSNLEDYTRRGWCQLEAFLCLITGCDAHLVFAADGERFFCKLRGGASVWQATATVMGVTDHWLKYTQENDHEIATSKYDSSDITQLWWNSSLRCADEATNGWKVPKGVDPESSHRDALFVKYGSQFFEPSHTMRNAVQALKGCNEEQLRKIFSMTLERADLRGPLQAVHDSFGDLASEADRMVLVRFVLCVLGFAMGFLDAEGRVRPAAAGAGPAPAAAAAARGTAPARGGAAEEGAPAEGVETGCGDLLKMCFGPVLEEPGRTDSAKVLPEPRSDAETSAARTETEMEEMAANEAAPPQEEDKEQAASLAAERKKEVIQDGEPVASASSDKIHQEKDGNANTIKSEGKKAQEEKQPGQREGEQQQMQQQQPQQTVAQTSKSGCNCVVM